MELPTGMVVDGIGVTVVFVSVAGFKGFVIF